MKNTLTIEENKIAICEKFVKEMSKMMHMERPNSEQQRESAYILSEVEAIMAKWVDEQKNK